LLLDADEKIRVTDFGLARQLAEKQPQFAELAGTAAFMAPEQVDSCWGKISERTDVYGLGAVLYTLLTNLPPYVGTVADVLAQIVCGRSHPGVAVVRSNVPDKLVAICARCMVKNPAERYSSANELATALQSIPLNGS
jgi:serine/threonine protein kinase